jgi:hypothetical protein
VVGGEVGSRKATRREGEELEDPETGSGGGGASGVVMSSSMWGMLDSVGRLALTIPGGTSSCSSRSWTESMLKTLAMLSRLLFGTAGKDIRRKGRYVGRDSRVRSWEGGRDDAGVTGERPPGEEERGERGEAGDSGSVAINEDLGVEGRLFDLAESLDRVKLSGGNGRWSDSIASW